MAKSGIARPKIGAAIGMAIIFGISGCASAGVNPAAEPVLTETEVETSTDIPTLVDTDQTPEETAAPDKFSSATRTADAESAEDLVVTDIQASAHDVGDQVTITLSGTGEPGYQVELVDQAVQDGSGFVHDTGGDQVLLVTLTGMTFPMDVDATEFAGSLNFAGEVVNQVIYDAWFEGAVRIFVTVNSDVADPVFTVARSENPSQVVIEVAPTAAVS